MIMKKILLSIVGACLMIVLVLNRDILAQALNGDVNKDGQVNVVDYQMVQSLYGTTSATADFNLNGIVDLFDVNTVIANIYLKQKATATPTAPVSDPTSTPKPPTATAKPTSGVTTAPTIAVPSPTTGATIPTTPPSPGANEIGDIQLTYKKGGIWLTEEEIKQIPMDNADWENLVAYSKETLTIEKDLICTAGGDYGCTADSKTPKRILARAIVGMRTGNTAMLDGLKAYLSNNVPAAINAASDKLNDEKWAERNLGPIAVAANIIDHRPQALLDSLYNALYVWKYCKSANCPDPETIHYKGLHYLTNLPSWGRWSVFTTAYLLEDWNTVNAVAKAEAKMLGEPLWNGQDNNAPIQYTGGGAGDDQWHKLPVVGGRVLLVMPAGATYVYGGQTRYIGGLHIGDTWRSAPSTTWPPAETGDSNYIWEGMAPNVAIVWAAHHLGYKDVFKWGDYALLRAAIFNYSTHDGKSAVTAKEYNDQWQNAALMAWAYNEIGPVLPNRLKPDPRAVATWPLPVVPKSDPGRGMGFMYATHYARLAR